MLKEWSWDHLKKGLKCEQKGFQINLKEVKIIESF